MSNAAGFDIRIPLGWLFVALGAILAIWGMLAPADVYARSLGINVNLLWGIVMLVFGAACLGLARRARGRAKPPGEVPAEPRP